VESPSSLRRGETVGLRLFGINNMDREVMALIILLGSPDYFFVQTDKKGHSRSYDPSLVRGEHHHMVILKPGTYKEVYMPISPQVEKGTITVKLRVMSQISSQDFNVDLEILPEGATINRHTSMLLDLKNRAHLLKYFDIGVEESPLIPYFDYRRYVFGSPRASVTLTGDFFGPVFPSMPVTTGSILSRSLRGTEAHLFNLATTLWSLHYLRLTRQLEPSVMYQGLEMMNIQMAALMRLYNPQGSFQLFTKSNPSVWATAWVIRILSQSQFQDWENHYFVDRELLSSCVKWILLHQNNDGSFHEPHKYARVRGYASHSFDSGEWRNASKSIEHTAHVLLALSKCGDSLTGKLKVQASNARLLAIRLLENKISSMDNSYDVPIVVHALSINNSPAKEMAFNKMHQLRRETNGMIYWSQNPVPVNGIMYENNRPFILPRQPSQHDARAVESTAYALMVRLARDGVGDFEERVVTWLNTMRMVEGGFVSVFDSITAMEALTEYAYRARLRDITDMRVFVEPSASPNVSHNYNIQHDTLAAVHQFQIPNVWGHVNIIGEGAGQAVIQLKVQYGIDWNEMKDKPTHPYFDLVIKENYSYFRNKSHVNVKACFKWLAINESRHSSIAVLEVEAPSGYGLVQSDADAIVNKEEHSFLLDVTVGDNQKVVWIIDQIGQDEICFQYDLRRWYPVANLTQYRSAIVYEFSRPEHFEMTIFNSDPLYFLGICEVCGSYQCPYCPYFSAASVVLTQPLVYFVSVIVFLFVSSAPPF